MFFLEIGKPYPFFVPNNEVSSKSLNVKWGVDCRDLLIVRAYNLSYCPTRSDVNEKICLEEEKFVVLHDPQLEQYKIEGLKPSTEYLIALQIISISGKNGSKNSTMAKTKEDSEY